MLFRSEWRLNVLRQEVLDSVNLFDERRGILHVRRHLAASPLFKGIPNFKETRIAMLRAETVKELFSILDYIRGNYGMNSKCYNVLMCQLPCGIQHSQLAH